MTATRPDSVLSIVIPARDEAIGLRRLLPETARVMEPLGLRAEIVVVDDGSADDTAAVAASFESRLGLPVVVIRTEPGGQSAAMAAGIASARGDLVAFLDGDGQNDPADLPGFLDQIARAEVDLVQGDRTASRCDGLRRRLASSIGRIARRVLLGDRVRDTGCTLRVMRRSIAVQLPLHRPGMHRFIPVLARGLGAEVQERAVAHRARVGGRSHYPTFGRAWPGLRGCLAVRRELRRARPLRTASTHGRPAVGTAIAIPPSATV